MYNYSNRSLKNRLGVHQDLLIVFDVVLKYIDHTVICGVRTVKEQQGLYAQGRTENGPIVTMKDGINSKSRHQSGEAIDVVPFPSFYSDKEKVIEFAGFVLGIAKMLKKQGLIENEIEHGGYWSIGDWNHFQLKS